MAFRISEFKSQMDWFGGPARGSLFEVQIISPRNIKSRANSRDMVFFCKNATIPGMVISAAENQQVAQFRRMQPTGFSSEPVQTLFMLDSDMQVASFFHSWIQNVVNYSTAAGPFSEVNGKLPFEVGYKEEYACRVIIRHYSTHYETSGVFYEVILENAFPILVGDIDLAWENNDQYSVLPVQFQYDGIQVTGEKIGNPFARFGRGNGVLGLLNAVGNFGQLIGQNLVPQNVQDAVNKFTRVNNFLDRL
jgi:hypothetical protein